MDSPDTYHLRCGRYGSMLVIDEDGSQWEVCLKCGEVIREAT